MNLGAISSFGASVTWAIGVSVYTLLFRKYGASTINFSRTVVAFLCFLLTFVFTTDHSIFLNINLERIGWLAVSIICSYAFADYLLLQAVQFIGLPSSLAIGSIYPLWSGLFGVIFLSQNFSTIKWLSLIMIVFGTIIVILSGSRNLENKSKHLNLKNGVLLSIATSILWALNAYSASKAAEEINVFQINTFRMFIAMILCPLIGRTLYGTKELFVQFQDFKKYFWVFILEGFGGALFFIYGLANTKLAIAATLSSLAPVISVPVAFLFGIEKPNLLKTIGVFIVVIGIWILVS